ncbi:MULTISPECIES: hypothetical protein [unclassified Rhizobium]|uniref:hypothetical protein n=1 Tax=unclassified Rhizobium TaxID=2613769 RepID=UPI001ADA945B|nr:MULTISPECIES: hypothetical protein [unclassified Rhizobium]MBO9122804.1 hypothetical protein [Rhizobium sp. 16-488-2b]MBO9173336.1 hypothetical protein [Rhizobium sp. 16-488-2a]
MPDIMVKATAEGMPKFDRSRIMQLAWKLFRKQWNGSRPANEASRRKSFSRCLKSAWMTVKWEAAEALKTIQQRAADRVHELTAELMRVNARPWRMRVEGDRLALQAEISRLQATARL